MNVANRRPNGWTDWAEFFVETHGWSAGVLAKKYLKLFNFLFHWQRRALQLVFVDFKNSI